MGERILRLPARPRGPADGGSAQVTLPADWPSRGVSLVHAAPTPLYAACEVVNSDLACSPGGGPHPVAERHESWWLALPEVARGDLCS